MKKIIFICICLLISLTIQADEKYFVTALNGLIVRDAPDSESDKLGKIPYGMALSVLEEGKNTFQIKDKAKVINGQWVKVSFWNFPYEILDKKGVYHSNGYVFSGYLEKLNKIGT